MYEQLSLGIICSFFSAYKIFCNPKEQQKKEVAQCSLQKKGLGTGLLDVRG